MPIWAYIGGGAFLAGILGGWTVRDWKADSDQLSAQNDALKIERQLRDKLGQRAGEYEQFRAANEQAGTTIRTQIKEVFRDVPVQSNCALPDAAGIVLDDALSRANAAARGEPGGPVQSPSPAP
jgi:hypothetical protein